MFERVVLATAAGAAAVVTVFWVRDRMQSSRSVSVTERRPARQESSPSDCPEVRLFPLECVSGSQLRISIMIGCTSGGLECMQEAQDVKDACGGQAWDVKSNTKVTKDNFIDCLRRDDPHVVHIACHADDADGLHLNASAGSSGAVYVPFDQIAAAIKTHQVLSRESITLSDDPAVRVWGCIASYFPIVCAPGG